MQLQIFNFGNNEVRTVLIENEPYFVGKDVANILEYKDTINALKSHVDSEDKMGWQITTPSRGKQEMTVINESGLYSLVFSSKLPQAKNFKRWVTSEVLPTLRKTGTYSTNTKTKTNPSERLRIMEMNAKSRMAKIYMQMADVDTLSKEYKNILVSKAAETLSGQQILPLPKQERKTYSATEIGALLGIKKNMVGKIANANNLKTNEYGEMYRSKSEYSSKEVDTWRYYDTVIPVMKEFV